MFHVKHSDTIAAIATPLGEGGVGVVRVSGDQSIRISEGMIKDFPRNIEPRRVYHGWIVDHNKRIDEVLYFYMKAPDSYTGEDVIEISCHGGLAVTKSVLELAIRVGARLADRGEFTKRAFLSGKIDLTQAEAVLDIIKAKNSDGAGEAAKQLEGKLSNRVRSMREQLIGQLAHVESAIDFPDDVPEIDRNETNAKIVGLMDSIEGLLQSAEVGMILRQGLATVIVGKPNTGKSSLLNALLRMDRAIVTDIPGTTRDTIEEQVNLRGLSLRLIDTAGIRHPKDAAEEFGVIKAKKELSASGLALIVLDASQGLDDNDIMVLNEAKGKKAIIVLNKNDLTPTIDPSKIKPFTNGSPIFRVSALLGSGIPELESGILAYVGFNQAAIGNGSLFINLRHKDCLMRANDALGRALDSFQASMPLDLVSIDLKGAILALGEVTGEVVSDEVIDRIFSEFCIGK